MLKQHKDKVACVLCDVAMSGMDGWATMARLREIVPGLPIALVSALGEEQVLAIASGPMPEATLTKPYRVDALRKLVSSLLEHRAKRSSLP